MPTAEDVVPTYEYACRECDEHLEVHQSFTDPPLTECPACKGPLRKVFGNIAITFKGSGFYKTDSRDTAKKGAKAGDGDGAAKREGSGSSAPASTSSDSSSSSSTSTSSTSTSSASTSSSGATPAAAAS
ncbi:MAG TPA: FmdB family zinc ribbon protein [Acidimicrobiales bacterium]|nr:FmdB family zinc ribbon protein [Acidimicrobiales bacterium]